MTAQPQVISAGHLGASPSPQAAALAAVQSPSQASTTSLTSATTPGIMSMATSLPQQVPGATAGMDSNTF